MKEEVILEKKAKAKAAALAYDKIGVPRLVAKGEGEVALKIIEKARAEGIPLQQNLMLVEALLNIELSKEIPPELYPVVAEVLAFVYRLNMLKNKDQ